MLLPEDVHPENSLYYSGAIVLESLKALGEAPLMDLFLETQTRRAIPMPLFVLSLDWLYLAGCVLKQTNGIYKPCS